MAVSHVRTNECGVIVSTVTKFYNLYVMLPFFDEKLVKEPVFNSLNCVQRGDKMTFFSMKEPFMRFERRFKLRRTFDRLRRAFLLWNTSLSKKVRKVGLFRPLQPWGFFLDSATQVYAQSNFVATALTCTFCLLVKTIHATVPSGYYYTCSKCESNKFAERVCAFFIKKLLRAFLHWYGYTCCKCESNKLAETVCAFFIKKLRRAFLHWNQNAVTGQNSVKKYQFQKSLSFIVILKITLRHWYLRSLELKSARIARDLIKGEEVDAAIKAATVSSKNRVKRKKKKCVLAQQLNTTAAMPATIEEDEIFVCSLSELTMDVVYGDGGGAIPVDVPSSSVATALTCVVCYHAESSHAVVPCGHRCLCGTCADMILQKAGPFCPVCRADALMAIRIFG